MAKKQMSRERFKEYLDILHDFGGFDPSMVINGNGLAEVKQKIKMVARMKAHEEKYGSVSDLMHERLNNGHGEDWGNYLMLQDLDRR